MGVSFYLFGFVFRLVRELFTHLYAFCFTMKASFSDGVNSSNPLLFKVNRYTLSIQASLKPDATGLGESLL